MTQDPRKPKPKINPYVLSRPGVTPGLLDTLIAITQGQRTTSPSIDTLPIEHGFVKTHGDMAELGNYSNPSDIVRIHAMLDDPLLQSNLINHTGISSRDVLLHEFGHRLDFSGGDPLADRFKDAYKMVTNPTRNRAITMERLSHGNTETYEMAKRIVALLEGLDSHR